MLAAYRIHGITAGTALQCFMVQLGLIADLTYARHCRVAAGTLAEPDVASHYVLFIPVFGRFIRLTAFLPLKFCIYKFTTLVSAFIQ